MTVTFVLPDHTTPNQLDETTLPARLADSLLTTSAAATASMSVSATNEPELAALWDSTTKGHLVTFVRFRQLQDLASSTPSQRNEASPSELPDICMYDHYLRIMRTPTMSDADVLISAMPLFAAVAADLVHVRLSPDGVLDIVALMDRTVRRGCAATGVDGDPLTTVPGAAADYDLSSQLAGRLYAPQSLVGRWKYGHQLYGLANRNAVAFLDGANDAYVACDYEQAAALLDQAATETAAVTASMNYAAALTATEYQSTVRPTMSPPYTETDLTGFMNLDHRAYRAAVAQFTATCNDTWNDLARKSLALADARERLLQRDLQDLTAHVELTYRLVGDVSAIDETDDGSAVQALRARLVNRTQTYSRWLRLGSWTHRPWKDDATNQNGPHS